ncbi:MAG: thiosulfate oxidation carrier complex protein SoxZ [Alphaproteobacteria bacterium]|nr:thiosulfate oxidation carrier complex protein SoxZ [Alphaproteobacteria bacterium]
MTQDIKPRIRLPSQIKPGEVIEVKTLVTHDMESGHRRDAAGKLMPRKILNKMTCAYNGRTVFEASLEPAIAANPYIAFFLKATESGTLEFAWTDDDGAVHRARQAIKVG